MADLSAGAEFAGYRIEGVAGRGGMGIVYRARQRRPSRLVALKVIAPDLAKDPKFRERFERESQLAAQIEHPHVIPLYGVGEEDGSLYIVTRFVRGTDLRQAISAAGSLEPPVAARIVDQVGDALDSAHEDGLIHRDVKPANVMIEERRRGEHAYLTDFGLAKQAASRSGVTAMGHFVGTIDYMAPEQFEASALDARADVYSLGCVLFEALAGRVPYPLEGEPAKMFAHMRSPPPSVRDSAPWVPQELDSVVERALAKDREERYPSAGDLGKAARAAAGRGEGSSGAWRRSRAAVAPATSPPDGPSSDSPETEPARPAPPVPAAAPTVGAGAARSPHEATRPETRASPPGPVAQPTAGAAAPDPQAGARTSTDEPSAPHVRPPAELASPEAKPALRSGHPMAAVLERWKLLAAVGAVAVVAVVVIVLAVAPGAAVEVGPKPFGVAVREGSVWVANSGADAVSRIDARSGEVVGAPIEVGREPLGIAVGDGYALVANNGDGTVSTIDVAAGRVDANPIEVGREPLGIAIGQDAAWVTEGPRGSVARIDASSGRVGARIKVGADPSSVAIGEGAVWVANSGDGTVSRIDPGSGRVVSIKVGPRPLGITAGEGSVWVANSGDGTVSRIDAQSGEVVGDPIVVGREPIGIAVGEGSVWAANFGDGTVSRIDARSGELAGGPIDVGREPVGIAVGQGSVWVANYGDGTVSRIGT